MRDFYKIIVFGVFTLLFKFNYAQDVILNLEDSIRENIYSNPKKAITYLHKYMSINEDQNNLDNIILGNSALAAAHEVMNQIDSSLYYHYKNLSVVQKPIDIIRCKYSISRVLEAENRYKEALRLYYQILKLAKENNEEETIKTVKISIETLKNKISKSISAITLLKEDYEKKLLNDDANLKFTRKMLIEAYLKVENLDEALNLINSGLEEATLKNDCEFIYYMNFFKSKIDVLRKDFSLAKQDVKSALECAKKLNNQEFINEIQYRAAEMAYINKNFQVALNKLKRINNSDIAKTTLQLTKYYKLTADAYKQLDSSDLSAKYYYMYVEEKEKLSESRLSTLETLYDFNLNEQVSQIQDTYESELNQEITQKEKYKKTKWIWTGVSGVLLALIIGVFLFFKNKSIKNQKRFDDLMVKINDFEGRKAIESKSKSDNQDTPESLVKEEIIELLKTTEENNLEEIDKEQLESETEVTYTIDDKKVEEILLKIQKLEDKNYFLRQDCTLHNMAKKLKTNTSYLSKIINSHIDKSFSTYINELRINYAILELKNNKRLRSYSVKGIAEEMGYKNADAFSRYFRAATGITPSVYIKKIQEI